MAASESQGPVNLRGTPNFYRVMFFLSLILLVLLPLGVLSSDVWLEFREKQLEADTSALEAELESLSQHIAADSNEVDAKFLSSVTYIRRRSCLRENVL
jgi:hypothetical protein